MMSSVVSQMARSAERLEVRPLTICRIVVLVAHCECPLVCVERFAKSTTLLAATLALPISLFLDTKSNLLPIVRIQLASHRHGLTSPRRSNRRAGPRIHTTNLPCLGQGEPPSQYNGNSPCPNPNDRVACGQALFAADTRSRQITPSTRSNTFSYPYSPRGLMVSSRHVPNLPLLS